MGYRTRCHMLGRECPEAVLPDRALYLPTLSHLMIVNKLPPFPVFDSSLSYSLYPLHLRRATWPNGEWGHSTRRHMLELVRAEAVSPDRALCLLTFSHSLIVNKTYLTLCEPIPYHHSRFALGLRKLRAHSFESPFPLPLPPSSFPPDALPRFPY